MPNGSEEGRHLTFSQREGVAPLPEPMELGKLSMNFRVRAGRTITDKIEDDRDFVNNFYRQNSQNMPGILADFNSRY